MNDSSVNNSAQAKPGTRLFVLLQYCLPQHLLTALIYRLAQIRYTPIKNGLIRGFNKLYKVNLDELEKPVPDGFATFNEFFTRQLRADARAITADIDAIASPVDGTISQIGQIAGDTIFQAKRHKYDIDALLASDIADARQYQNGAFTTIYLAPYNYHRIHAPLDGELQSIRYVPGALFSVNQATVSGVPGLFARNERLVCQFTTAHGPLAIVFVGALNVGSISTPWTGEIRPRKKGLVEEIDMKTLQAGTSVHKGDLLGWFNMGSTVILLLPAAHWRDDLVAGKSVQMGESLGASISA